MIPNYQVFMRPFLEFAQQGEVTLKEVQAHLADKFSLSDEDLSQLLKSGRQTVFHSRVGWARTYLTKSKLLKTTKRAHFVITERGKDAIAKPETEINNAYLAQFEEFQEFAGKSKSSNVIATPSKGDNSTTPDETLRQAYDEINQSLADEILDRTREVSPAFFEQLLIDLLLAMGYGGTGEGAAHALGKTGDNGVDGVIDQDPLGVDQIYIQAKRYAEDNKVNAGDIRDFFGALNLKKAQKRDLHNHIRFHVFSDTNRTRFGYSHRTY